MNSAFSFQVISKGVIINLNPEIGFSQLKNSLLKHVNEATEFFAGVDLYINLNGRELEISRLREIMEIVEQYHKVEKIYFSNEEDKKENKVSLTKNTILIKRTLRSGQKVKYPTNVVIMGDINPGAEVIAGGDVIVLGKLRGVVHAGANGTKSAEVIALQLEPTQLRISNIISRPPDHDDSGDDIKPEKAFVKDSSIIVEELCG